MRACLFDVFTAARMVFRDYRIYVFEVAKRFAVESLAHKIVKRRGLVVFGW
jgi:hypothetical protein